MKIRKAETSETTAAFLPLPREGKLCMDCRYFDGEKIARKSGFFGKRPYFWNLKMINMEIMQRMPVKKHK